MLIISVLCPSDFGRKLRENERVDVQGESDICSAPPVKTTSASPSLISWAALIMVWKPLPQSL